jgi:hypothetical protein
MVYLSSVINIICTLSDRKAGTSNEFPLVSMGLRHKVYFYVEDYLIEYPSISNPLGKIDVARATTTIPIIPMFPGFHSDESCHRRKWQHNLEEFAAGVTMGRSSRCIDVVVIGYHLTEPILDQTLHGVRFVDEPIQSSAMSHTVTFASVVIASPEPHIC